MAFTSRDWAILFLACLVAILATSETEANPRSLKLESRLKRNSLTHSYNKALYTEDQKEGRATADYRLPTNLSPTAQFIRLQPFVNGNRSIDGYTEITFNVSEATPNITLHQASLTIDESSVTVYEEANPSIFVPISSFDSVAQKDFWIVSLSQDLEVGKTYVMTVQYEGTLNTLYSGFFYASYKATDGSDVYYAATQFEPNGARRAFPCFDEPNFKAVFTTELIREDGMMSASNMPLVSSGATEGQPGWTTDRFSPSEIMPSYLNSFLVSDFGYDSISDGTITYKTHARNELVYSTTYSLTSTEGTLNYFEGYLNVPYPLPKLDSNALPEFFSGAMENWGLMNYIDFCLLYDSDVNTAANKQLICEIIGHEVAHNWFGNLVTVEFWDHIWIGEGFTEFHAYKGCNAVDPTMKVEDQFVSDVLQSALQLDDSETSHAMIFNLSGPAMNILVFDGITYDKGSSLARMMEYFVTESTFNTAMTNYLIEYAFSNTVQDQLFEAVNEQAMIDGTLDPSLTVKMIMDTWTLQMGYPVLTVQRNTDGTALLTQERFIMRPDPDIVDTHDYKWYIPITLTTQAAPNFDQFDVEWMSPDEAQKNISGIPAVGQWYIINMQHGGFFRVNYDTDSWTDIITQLNTDHTIIHVMNRIELISDAFNLAKAGRQTYDIAMGTAEFLQFEDEYSVLDMGTSELFYIDAMFRTQAEYGSFKLFLSDMILPTYNSVGFDDSTSDPFLDQRKRELSVSIACYLDYQPCLDDAKALFDQWMLDQDNYTIISPNLKDPVYCYGVEEGGMTEFDALYNQYLNTLFNAEQNNLLYGMGCSQDVAILNRYLDMAFNETSGISKNDVTRVISSISSTVVGESVAWDYIRNNDDAIAAYMGSYSDVELYVFIVSTNFNTESRLQELEQFRADNAADIGIGSLVDVAISNTELNIEWMNRYFNDVVTWLNGYPFSK